MWPFKKKVKTLPNEIVPENKVEEVKETASVTHPVANKSAGRAKPILIPVHKSETKHKSKAEKAVVTETKSKSTTNKSIATEKKKAPNSPKKTTATEVEKEEAVAPIDPKPNEKITGRFEIKKAKDGRFVFNLYASNHVIVATSQVYSSAQSALVGINSVIANAERAPIEDQTLKKYETQNYPKWEIYLDRGEQYRFKLLASNGSCVCHSQGYTSKTNCKSGIESIIRSSRNAEIDKSYLKK